MNVITDDFTSFGPEFPLNPRRIKSPGVNMRNMIFHHTLPFESIILYFSKPLNSIQIKAHKFVMTS